ncbi:terminase small subunit [Alicyclobacillus sendaiensis]|uniref:terminase small subunit n=1 Tax=Alicyclobacillus sendaiensis TaxID=192387 RepID=UPI0026F44379|nr:terminase small subunit [Alicyclobacillus sendaiensis]
MAKQKVNDAQKPKVKDELTPRQQRFVEEYLIDLNATQAAIRAGYAPASASVEGARQLANAKVRARIDKALAERSKRTGINADLVIQELARIARVNPIDVIDPDTGEIKTDAVDDLAAVASVRVKVTPTRNGDVVEREVRMADKLKALELLGKHLGMFVERREVTGKDGGPIQLEAMTTEERERRIQELLAKRGIVVDITD